MSTVKVGMFGGSNGDVCDITGLSSFAPSSLRSMEIWSTPGHDGVINAIRFTFVDSKNNAILTIHLTNVRVIELSGYTNGQYITSLTFRTTDAPRHHGPFGKVRPATGSDTYFRIPLMHGSIVAFCAHRLSAIGAYLKN
ncbi:hypothetical protein VPH35_025932 [Triticum aestivum]